jgi:hypothetical protein
MTDPSLLSLYLHLAISKSLSDLNVNIYLTDRLTPLFLSPPYNFRKFN